MNEPFQGGERGASILASLVIVAMLGGVALVADLSNSSGDSQVASSLAVADTDAVAAKKAAEEKAAKAKADAERKKAIEQKCKEAKDSLVKAQVGEATRHAPTTFESNEDPVEPSRCVGAIKNTAGVECVGLESKIVLLSDGRVRVTSSPKEGVEPGTCKSNYCSFELNENKKAEEKCKPANIDGYRPLKKQAREQNLHNDLGPNANNNLLSGPIDEREGKILADALRPEQQKAQDEYEKAKVETKGALDAYNKITCVAGDTACKDLKEGAEKDLNAAREKEEAAKKRFDELSKQIKRLESGGGPPDGKDDKGGDTDKGDCPPNCGPTDPGNSYPGPGSYHGGGPPGSTFPPLGGQPPPGNQTPHPPGTCYGGQTICQGNTLYSRNNQCIDTPVQYCQYGCAQQQSSGSSAFLRFFGGSSGRSDRCAPPPQQGQGCPPPPVQPQQPCQNGTWRPTYGGQNNSCVVGWQCVPTGGGGTLPLTAQLSCQPHVVDVGMTIAITYSCSSGTSIGAGFQTGGAQTGSTTVTVSDPPGNANVATYGLTCSDQGTAASKQCSVQVAKPAIVLVANPKSVPSGTTSAIGWVTSGMQSCIISSPELSDFTEQHKNATNVNGAVVTPPLSSPATFVLKCATIGGGTRAASTTVSIL